jgi:hypothetical protein
MTSRSVQHLKIFTGEREMSGYDIEKEIYTPLGHKSIACTLVLENGYEVTGTYCIEVNDLIYEDKWKQRAFKNAFHEYSKMKNAIEQQLLFTITQRGESYGKESVRGLDGPAEEIL